MPYCSGPVEGTVNRIKMLKRQMYGRPKFDLLANGSYRMMLTNPRSVRSRNVGQNHFGLTFPTAQRRAIWVPRLAEEA
jgi:tRNA(Glu) U13 pseudouridine synthase TruD